MTQLRADYLVPGIDINQDALRAFDDPLYCAPTWQDIRAVKKRFGLTGLSISRIIGVDDRTVRNYISNPETVGRNHHTKIPYAQWRLLLIATKLAMPPEI